MERLLYIATFAAALGAGLVAGIFFAFSTFVMGALGRLPQAAGISAMQSINVVVINPVFLSVFMGTALLSVALTIAALIGWSSPKSLYVIAGSVLYVGGCFLVTMLCNVPLNNALAAVAPDSAEGAKLWARYLTEWTNWNHVRTAASLAASVFFILALG
ncbi:MAG: DUF1772 domain-containing protein [Pseudorhodoplanes sp.]|nr:DUF1772 domain-containing protein [Pseudorhodoplanes sp.]